MSMPDSNQAALDSKELEDDKNEAIQKEILENMTDDNLVDQIITDFETAPRKRIDEIIIDLFSPNSTALEYQKTKEKIQEEAQNNYIKRRIQG